MKSNINLAAKLFLKRVFATLMSLVILISVTVICTVAFSENVGYNVYGEKNGGEREFLYSYRFSEGKDTKKQEYEDKGYELTVLDVKELGKKGNKAMLTISQILSIAILFVVLYPNMWNQGFSDRNMSNLGHIKADKLRGLKIGLLSSVPSALFVVVLFILSIGLYPKMDISLYKFINGTFYSLSRVIIGSAETVGEVKIISFVYLLLLQLIAPIAAAFGYVLGMSGISIKERLTYKKETKV